MPYPSREPFFANKLIRALTKTCAIADIGHPAFALVCVIAHTEDAKRYAGPVTYYNTQLQALLGLRKWESLDRARSAACTAGWLHYETGGNKRKPGIYWALMPGHITVDDTPCDEGLSPLDGYEGGYKEGYEEGYRRGYKEGELSNLSLPLSPDASPAAAAPASSSSKRERKSAGVRWGARMHLTDGERDEWLLLCADLSLTDSECRRILTHARTLHTGDGQPYWSEVKQGIASIQADRRRAASCSQTETTLAQAPRREKCRENARKGA